MLVLKVLVSIRSCKTTKMQRNDFSANATAGIFTLSRVRAEIGEDIKVSIMNNAGKPHLGRDFRDMRRRAGLSLQALGANVGVDPSTISRWESRREFVQFSRFVKALHKLGTTPEEFLRMPPPDGAQKGRSLHSS